MRIDPVIQFAQERFGAEADAGPVLPNWLVGRVEEAIPFEGDEVSIDGDASSDAEPQPASDGITPDNLAFYLPFHFYQKSWGIYIRASGVWALARRIAAGAVDLERLMNAYRVLFEHERFHFIAEYAASRIEVVTAKSSYREYSSEQCAAKHEEALANAWALCRLRRRAPSVVGAISNWMRGQPPGYRGFEKWMPPRFVAGERQAAVFMARHEAALNRLLGQDHPAEFLFRGSPNRLIPIYWVFDVPPAWIRLVKPFPKYLGVRVLVHSNDHKPPHIHIQAPPGRDRTRYRWPELTPLDGDPTLRSKDRKNLDCYIAAYGKDIDDRIKRIAWQ